ncbi:DUF4280 domain-containing protein [Roseateles amylovorans]|jgi:Domain of unknown function (DUF4280)|uniref:DUF4280 domain-containing protein n=1 Tax=Roseateles amylovorans TaxID=2978473 RepID=A0ABY6AZC4_9BURK|nr:DUF4280 domain-containing protein [Roseateles amylovorans]UXH78526.1 DUF4280 domain-containing protein [Roseateles amylovorans]
MALHVCTGALLQCSFGLLPAVFTATPRPVLTAARPAGTVLDHLPLVHIPSFGLCRCAGNPSVAAATAAALGVLTPMPCLPATPLPWLPGAVTVLLEGQPALDDVCTLACVWGGEIRVLQAGQFTHQIP